MKLLMVATNREDSPYPVAPLGALCVIAATRKAGHQVDFLDLAMARQPQRALDTALQQNEYQAVAFAIRNLDNCWAFAPRSYFEEVRLLTETTRSRFKGTLILGGSGFSVAPQGWMQRLQADYGVIGEGERAFPTLLAKLETRNPVTALDGVISKDNHPADAHPAPPIQHLDELPAPAHELCGYARYLKHGGFVGVQTKRGCPLGCVYCIYPLLEGRRYRLRPPDSVVQEIESVVLGSNLKHFFFVDSVFNDPRSHALAVCAALARRRLPVRWSAFCNPLGFDAEMARTMAEAGCSGVEFGLDVATPKMLDALGKPFGQHEIRVALKAARDAGLPFAVYLLFGGPGETWADVKETQNFLNECAPANAVFACFGIRIYEGTPLADVAKREGQLAPNADLFEPAYYMSPDLAKDTEKTLDGIARRRAEWSSPVDWRRPITRWGQKVTVWLNVRPQWKHLRKYGRYMRRQSA